MSNAPIQLRYEMPVPRRRAARVAGWAAAVVVAILTLRHWPAVEHQARLLYWQRQAMTYAAPASAVVLENNPKRVGALAANSPDFVLVRAMSSSSLPAPPPIQYFAAPWREFYRLFAPPGRKAGAVLFLHGRSAPGAEPRLVAIDTQWVCSSAVLQVSATVFRPGGIVSRPQLLSESSIVLQTTMPTPGYIRVYAGQPDPDDASHLTIRYVCNGQRHVIDGWLDRFDHVTLTDSVRGGSITPPAQVSMAQSH